MPTTEDFKAVFDILQIDGKLTDAHKKMLCAHLCSPKQIITASKLALAAGYVNFRQANLEYGKLGRKVGERLNYFPRIKNGRAIPTWCIATGTSKSANPEGHYEWTLRPEVKEALEKLGWCIIKD